MTLSFFSLKLILCFRFRALQKFHRLRRFSSSLSVCLYRISVLALAFVVCAGIFYSYAEIALTASRPRNDVERVVFVRNDVMGMQALRTLNIIEIDYSPYLPEENFRRRDASLFKLLRLYSPEILEKDKQRVRELYSERRFEEAERYAKIVFKGNDTRVIEDIIKKIDEYGAKEVAEAFKVVSKKSVDNPKRSYKYVVGVLQKKAGEAAIIKNILTTTVKSDKLIFP